jgi:hypothetical protein
MRSQPYDASAAAAGVYGPPLAYSAPCEPPGGGAAAAAAVVHQLQLIGAGVGGAPQLLHATLGLLAASAPPPVAPEAGGGWDAPAGSAAGTSEAHAAAALQLLRALVALDSASCRVVCELLGVRPAAARAGAGAALAAA